MKEFSPIEINRTEDFIKQFPIQNSRIGEIDFFYRIIPQSINPKLPDFAFRMTRTNPETKQTSGIFGVSDSVPTELRPYWVAHEVIEFTKIGINTKGRCNLAELKVMSLIPDNLKEQYVNRRIPFFSNLINLFKEEVAKNTGNFTEDDIKEAEATLNYLKNLSTQE
jgi:hypothetical protein